MRMRFGHTFSTAACLALLLPAIATADKTQIDADIWADNWFALYIGEQLIMEDSVPITTERSFNKESFTFEADLPAQLNLIVKDFKENNTGLEYIGSRRQQMGDGGFILQLKNSQSGETMLVSSSEFRCFVTHKAPLNKDCEKSSSPQTDCQVESDDAPAGWMSAAFDDSAWASASEYSESEVRPKDGYDRVTWDNNAKLIWTSDLESDNTLLCRALIAG